MDWRQEGIGGHTQLSTDTNRDTQGERDKHKAQGSRNVGNTGKLKGKLPNPDSWKMSHLTEALLSHSPAVSA